MNPRFTLGIDLGTSNCAMAVADHDGDSTDVLPITQIVAANRVGEMRTLASSLYLPHPEEFPAGSFQLPWDAAGPGIVGQFARDHGALIGVGGRQGDLDAGNPLGDATCHLDQAK